MLDKNIADLICHGTYILRYQRWLDEEVNHLALRIAGLDAFPSHAVLPLVYLAANGEKDLQRLAAALDIEETLLVGYLESLCEFKFAEETGNGYMATQLGETACEAIGTQMVFRERFELKRRLAQVEHLYGKLGPS